jgi:hypothetical protein
MPRKLASFTLVAQTPNVINLPQPLTRNKVEKTWARMIFLNQE